MRKCIGWLTPREREVASLVITGLSNKQVGREPDLEEGTVKAHLSNIYRKTGVKNRTAARDPGGPPACTDGPGGGDAKGFWFTGFRLNRPAAPDCCCCGLGGTPVWLMVVSAGFCGSTLEATPGPC